MHDCFLLLNEETVLRARLSLLRDVVDRFVIVEATTTFQGDPRPPLLPTLSELPVPADRLVHVCIRASDLPAGTSAWDRQSIQRDAILRGLEGASGDDLVLVSDVDEIPRPEVVERLRDELDAPVSLGMRFSYYRTNLVAPETWSKAKACRRSQLTSPQQLRWERSLPVVEDAGWHVSYLGDEDAAARKLRSISAAQYASDRWTSRQHLERSMRLGVRLQGEIVFDLMPDDECIPTITRDAHPELFHPGRGRLQTVLARAYCFTAEHRARLPNWLTDRFPPLAFAAAVALRGSRWLLHQTHRIRQKAVLEIGRLRRSRPRSKER